MATTFVGRKYCIDYDIRTGEVYAAQRYRKPVMAHRDRFVRALALRMAPNIRREGRVLSAWIVKALGGPMDDIGLAELEVVESLRSAVLEERDPEKAE